MLTATSPPRRGSQPPLPPGFKVICSVCGEPLDAATQFSKGQLAKKHPRCRACAPNKFGNQQTGAHQSKKESRYAANLRAIYGEKLREQVRFELIPRQFVYKDQDGVLHVVDAKGWRTEVYRLKKKMMWWVHGIRIEEV